MRACCDEVAKYECNGCEFDAGLVIDGCVEGGKGAGSCLPVGDGFMCETAEMIEVLRSTSAECSCDCGDAKIGNWDDVKCGAEANGATEGTQVLGVDRIDVRDIAEDKTPAKTHRVAS